MRHSWRAIPVLALLILSNLVQPAPNPYGSTLAVRADDGLPKELQPVLQDDHLPAGHAKDAIQNTDFGITLDELKECPDFDPNQDDAGSESPPLRRRNPSRSTRVLREVYVKGRMILPCLHPPVIRSDFTDI